MRTFLLTCALLAACCTALVPTEFRNLTTTEIDYSSHAQTLIPAALKQVIATDQQENQFNTTDFILDKINYVSQKEFKTGYIYKINVDFINSAGEIAQTEFIGTYSIKTKEFSVYYLNYNVQYPQMGYDQEEEFKPSPINGTNSTGIFKDLRSYIMENFNNTAIYNRLNGYLFGNATMYNSTYLPQDFNMSSTYDAPQAYGNYSSYNNSGVNSTWGSYMIQNGTNSTNATYLSYSEFNGTATNNTWGTNMTENVYNTLNILVDRFNTTTNSTQNFEDIYKTIEEIDLEPLVGIVSEFLTRTFEESFGLDLEKLMTNLLETENIDEALPALIGNLQNIFA